VAGDLWVVYLLLTTAILLYKFPLTQACITDEHHVLQNAKSLYISQTTRRIRNTQTCRRITAPY